MTGVLGRRPQSDFLGEVHVYEPHVVGIPPLRPYLRELWRRRQFAAELSRTTLQAAHLNTAFGRLWLVLNPLLLGLVYFVLVDIIRPGARPPGFIAHLLGNLFFFFLVQQSVNEGASAVTGGGKLILNTAFPRLLLPLSSVLNAVRRFFPTLVVYAVVHVVAGYPVGAHLLLTVPIFLLVVIFSVGASALVSALQVYFRDTRNFLPYFLRIWLYMTPVLYYAEDIPARIKPIIALNPLYYLVGAWGEVLDGRGMPSLGFLAIGAACAVGMLLLGCLFFLSRERDFAVRL